MSKVSPLEQEVRKPQRRNLLDLFRHSAVRYLIVGGLSFLVDFGLLVLLHQFLGWPVSLATAVAFLSSLVFNFIVQRKFSFDAGHKTHVSMIRYALLVVANTVASVVIVELLTPTVLGYMGGKIISTAAMTVWNYFLYRHWIFGVSSPPRSGEPHRHQAP